MQNFIGEKKYKTGQVLFDIWEFVRHRPIFLYLVLISLVAVMAGVANRQVSFLALFDGEGVFTVKEIITQEDPDASQPTETFAIQAESLIGAFTGETDSIFSGENGDGGEVVIEQSSDLDSGTTIGGIDDDEWLSYTFTVPRTATYDIIARLARLQWEDNQLAYFRVEIDGKNVSGKLGLPDTGGWDKWVTLNVGQVNLSAGSHRLVFRMVGNNGRKSLMNVNWFQLVPLNDKPIPPEVVPGVPTPTPAPSPAPNPAPKPIPVPEIAKSFYIEAEDYGRNGKDKSYRDTTVGNSGGKYRNDDVDIESSSDIGYGYNVGWIADGEWLRYNFNVASETTFTLLSRVARLQRDGTSNTYYQLYIDRKAVGSRQSVRDTKGWQNWITLSSGKVTLSAGQHTLEFKAIDNKGSSSLMNLNWFKLVPAGQDWSTPPDTTVEPTPTPVPTPTPTPTPFPTPPPTSSGTGYNASKITITCPTIPSSNFTTVRPGDNVGGSVNQVFVFEPGTYYGLTIKPRDGQKFYAKKGVVFNGNGASQAFRGNADNVYICGFRISNYKPPRQQGTINGQNGDAGNGNTSALSYGWIIENVEVFNNIGGGIMLGSNATLRNSWIHDNTVIGIKASGASNVIFDNVSVGRNGFDNPNGWGDEGGGSKFAYTTNLTVRNSYIYDNVGPGLWTDIKNYGALYENNVVENNTVRGIFHEISFDGVIRYNLITNNGNRNCGGWSFACSGIYISSSEGANGKKIEIYGNTLKNNRNGIVGAPDSRGTVADMSVYNNTVINSGKSGVDKGGSPVSPVWSSISYRDNCYEGTNVFVWKTGSLSWSSWRSAGQDTNGSYNPSGGCPNRNN